MLTIQTPRRKSGEQDFARADLNFLMHVSQLETNHFYYLFLIFFTRNLWTHKYYT